MSTPLMIISDEVSNSPSFKALQLDTHCHCDMLIYSNSSNRCTGIKPGSAVTVKRVIYEHKNNKVAYRHLDIPLNCFTTAVPIDTDCILQIRRK